MIENPSPPPTSDGILFKCAKIFKQFFPSPSQKLILRHYIPMSGAISHSLFTLNLFNPLILKRLFPTNYIAISNAILFNSHLGLGFYMFFRPHMHRLWRWRRVEYCVFSSVIFNFGSILLSIFLRDFLPKKWSQSVRSFFGISLSFFLLHRARRYINYIDQRTILSGISKRNNKIKNNIIVSPSPSPSV
uniref:Uncharacterized protein n=1 Tax=Meloidogyne enterolobii TaxID=390850 RepID=A0A6V7U8Y7_MELEN|nr:unnamed protein product [Meloidogyne enterolobii]